MLNHKTLILLTIVQELPMGQGRLFYGSPYQILTGVYIILIIR